MIDRWNLFLWVSSLFVSYCTSNKKKRVPSWLSNNLRESSLHLKLLTFLRSGTANGTLIFNARQRRWCLFLWSEGRHSVTDEKLTGRCSREDWYCGEFLRSKHRPTSRRKRSIARSTYAETILFEIVQGDHADVPQVHFLIDRMTLPNVFVRLLFYLEDQTDVLFECLFRHWLMNTIVRSK